MTFSHWWHFDANQQEKYLLYMHLAAQGITGRASSSASQEVLGGGIVMCCGQYCLWSLSTQLGPETLKMMLSGSSHWESIGWASFVCLGPPRVTSSFLCIVLPTDEISVLMTV